MDLEQDPQDQPSTRRRLTVARPVAGEGIVWLRESWRLFRLAPLPWMGMTALVFLVLLLVASYTFRGLVEVVMPFIAAGYMSAARAAVRGEPVTFLHLGAGARNGLPALVGLGVIYMAATLLIDLVARQVSGDALDQLVLLAQQDPASIDPIAARQLLDEALPGILTAMLLLMPMLLATWFAPALVLFKDFSPLNGLWWSLWACLVNWRPMAMYAGVVMPLGFLAVLIPFGLGMLVFMPLFMIATYLAYRAIFVTVES